MRFSEKQIQVLRVVFGITNKLRPTSAIRKSAPEFSSHSEELQRAVDFGGPKNELLSVFLILLEKIHLGQIKFSIGIGFGKADRHIHVSNDDRSKIFIELEKPDKNGWVKVVSESEKGFAVYMDKVINEYSKSRNKKTFSFAWVLGLAFVGFFLAHRGINPPATIPRNRSG